MANNRNVGTVVPCEPHTYHLAVFIGRFQPLHLGHMHVVRTALRYADCLTILVGSSDQPRDTFNPWTFEERKEMIERSLTEDERPRVFVQPIYDHTYNDNAWIVGVQEKVRLAHEHFELNDGSARVTLVGHAKDHTSYYLKMFPQWGTLDVNGWESDEFVFSATTLRERFFHRDALAMTAHDLMPEVPRPVADYIAQWSQPGLGKTGKTVCPYMDILEEFEFVQRYKAPYAALPYKPIFTTVDACVVQSGHVLLIQRKARPGKGLWALPGGFLNADEWVDDAWVRELKEETGIKVPTAVLKGSLVAWDKFDAPHRSARGRTITFAYLVHLNEGELPKVKGADDAAKARWVPLADLRRSMMFEDHYHMIQSLVARLK